MQTLRESDTKLILQEGEEFAVVLKSTATAGYMWHPQYDAEALTLLSESSAQASLSTIGGSTEEVFTFRALCAGETTLQLSYHRGWESSSAQTLLFELQVIPASGKQ